MNENDVIQLKKDIKEETLVDEIKFNDSFLFQIIRGVGAGLIVVFLIYFVLY